MISFRTWLEEFESEKGSHIKVDLPSVRQGDDYDCGAAIFRAVCEHFEVGPEKQADFIKACKTTESGGTRPADMIRCAGRFGLNAKSKSGMSIEDLKSFLDMGRPIICPIQAYGDDDDYHEDGSGHYLGAVGYDEKHIYFEDPSMKGTRGFLPYKEFEKRWHDKDADGAVYEKYGIVIWKQSGEGTDREYLAQAKKIP